MKKIISLWIFTTYFLIAVEEWTGAGAAQGAWSTGGSLNTARDQVFGGAGTQTAALLAGGSPPPAGATVTESYDGTSWTEVNDLNTARTGFAVSGGQPAALVMGGSPNTAKTEEWNGSSIANKVLTD